MCIMTLKSHLSSLLLTTGKTLYSTLREYQILALTPLTSLLPAVALNRVFKVWRTLGKPGLGLVSLREQVQ